MNTSIKKLGRWGKTAPRCYIKKKIRPKTDRENPPNPGSLLTLGLLTRYLDWDRNERTTVTPGRVAQPKPSGAQRGCFFLQFFFLTNIVLRSEDINKYPWCHIIKECLQSSTGNGAQQCPAALIIYFLHSGFACWKISLYWYAGYRFKKHNKAVQGQFFAVTWGKKYKESLLGKRGKSRG